MKIEMQSPTQGQPQAPQQSGQQSARERAIAKLLGNQATPKAPVADPNSVSAEEMSAIPQTADAQSDEFTKAVKDAKAQEHLNESDSVESSPKEAPKSEETSEPLSSQYAVLARKQKLINQQTQQLKAREAELKAKEEAFNKPKEAEGFDKSKFISKEDLAKDPFTVLTDMGLTYDQLTELALNGPKPREIELMSELKAMKEELKALKGETESTKKSFMDYQNQNESMGINQLTKQATALVNSNPEFETIKETGSVGDVVELIKQTLKTDGVLLSVEEAAQEVENYLLEEALKLAKIKKIQQRLAPKAEPTAQKQSTEQPKQQQLKTLTNSVASTRPLSARERAILAMQGKLQK